MKPILVDKMFSEQKPTIFENQYQQNSQTVFKKFSSLQGVDTLLTVQQTKIEALKDFKPHFNSFNTLYIFCTTAEEEPL